MTLKIENIGKNFRRCTLKIYPTKTPTHNSGDMKMFDTPVTKNSDEVTLVLIYIGEKT